MKVISWNLWCKNRDQKKSINKVLEHCPDIVCLQEVSQSSMDFLKSLSEYEMYEAEDYLNSKNNKKNIFKLAILINKSTMHVDNHNIIDVRHITRKSLWDRLNKWQESLEFHYIDVIYKDKLLRVFNLHLEVGAGPKLRFEQFDYVAEHMSNENNIICGDFNIFARWYLNIAFGLGLGYQWHEFITNERMWFERKFRRLGLYNPFYNQKTYPRYNLQLDHILIPNEFNLSYSNVIPQLYGSDHYPIMLECDLKANKNTPLTIKFNQYEIREIL